jgi:CspA family cold shock protein
MMEQQLKRGVVKWFDFGKKYGFVTLENGDDAMLHLSALQHFNISAAPKGSSVEVVVEQKKRGLSVMRVVSMTPPDDIVALNGAHQCDTRNWVPATCKWFDAARGYGFVTRGENTPDVFVHAVIIKTSDLVDFRANQKVLVVVEEGPNGPKVAHIKAA